MAKGYELWLKHRESEHYIPRLLDYLINRVADDEMYLSEFDQFYWAYLDMRVRGDI